MVKTIVFTDEQIEMVGKLSGVGMNNDQLADFFEIGTTTFDTIIKRQPEVKRAILKGRSKGAGKVMNSLYQAATTGKNVTAMIFYLKTRCRWREADRGEHDGSETNGTRKAVKLNYSLGEGSNVSPDPERTQDEDAD